LKIGIANMKKSIFANLPCSRVIGFTAVFFLSILLSLVPFTALAQQEIDDGVAWLLANQNLLAIAVP